MLVEPNNTSSSSSIRCSKNTDNREHNRESSQRIRYRNKSKATIIEFYEKECDGLNTTKFCKKYNLQLCMIKI